MNLPVHMGKAPGFTTMLIGSRWLSDTFLVCIQQQGLQFNAGMSSQMLTSQQFHTLPNGPNFAKNPCTPNIAVPASCHQEMSELPPMKSFHPLPLQISSHDPPCFDFGCICTDFGPFFSQCNSLPGFREQGERIQTPKNQNFQPQNALLVDLHSTTSVMKRLSCDVFHSRQQTDRGGHDPPPDPWTPSTFHTATFHPAK